MYGKEYLARHHGIDPARIRVEFFGADRTPETADNTWESLRAIELIIEPVTKYPRELRRTR
ncbi:MAG: hypothetical protein FWC64_06100 [Treponema sp.]|nr:hypothetical protein [Treponema sp.]